MSRKWPNRSSGLGCATAAWESRAAMGASRPADDMRGRAASDPGGEIFDVHDFDLAYAHLYVPLRWPDIHASWPSPARPGSASHQGSPCQGSARVTSPPAGCSGRC